MYVPIHSIAHLRKLCQKRENLLNEEYFRRNQFSKNQNTPNRRIAAIYGPFEMRDNQNGPDSDDTIQFSVIGISNVHRTFVCWNCKDEGHRWDMCIKERSIFCYGCGLETYINHSAQTVRKIRKTYQGVHPIHPG